MWKTVSCEYLVIGAGAAGCVVAGRLSEDRDARVVVVEAGPAHRNLLTRVPATAFLASIAEKTNWNFTTEPVPALGDRRLQINQGRIVGGSGSINGMLYSRGHSREYDQWRGLGCDGWGSTDVLACFRKAENSDRGVSYWHGADGPLPIKRSVIDLPICGDFLKAMAEAGIPTVDDLNADVLDGFGAADVNISRGRRVSTAAAYLEPARKRGNLTVISDGRATRIIVEGGRASAVELAHPAGTSMVRATREVIICAGAINTPHLLLLSGIGPSDELAAAGIPVVLDRADVGRNLHNHPSLALTYSLRDPISAFGYMRPDRALTMAARYLLNKSGPLAESYVATCGVFRTDSALDIPDATVVMLPALVQRASVGARYADVIARQHGFTVLPSLGRPASRGRVAIRSSDPAVRPAVFLDYYAEPEDMRAMVSIVQRVREAMRGTSIGRRIRAELQPGDAVNDSATVERAIRDHGGTFHHPAGTCRMGPDCDAVVDARLRVKGIAGLRIADASIAPTPLNASMHAPTIMIGEKAAAMIAEDHASAPVSSAGVHSAIASH